MSPQPLRVLLGAAARLESPCALKISSVAPSQSLATVQRFKAFKKRPLRTTLLQLGPDIGIQVQLFKMLGKAGKAKKVQVTAETNEEVIVESAKVDGDTGAARYLSISQRRSLGH